jgi:hypothetical protein
MIAAAAVTGSIPVAGAVLWWLGGAATMAAIVGFARHKGLGIILLTVGGLLTFWAYTGSTISVPVPQVHQSVTPSASHT